MRRVVLVLMVMLGAGAAGAADEIRIVSHEAGDDSLRFTFNQPMLGWESNNVELRDVRIEPAIDCRWFWSDDVTLACSRQLEAKPPEPATKYTVHFDGGLWSQQGIEIKPTTLSFDYRRPEISIYEGSNWTDGRPVAELSANQLIDDAELRKVLRVTGTDGLPLGYRLQPATGWSTADRSSWELTLDNTAYRGDLDIAIKPGLKGRSGPLLGAQSQHLASYAYNEEFQFRGARCARSSSSKEFATKTVKCEAGRNVLLRFSRPLSKEALEMLDRQLPAGLSRLRSEAMEQLYRSGRNVQRAPEWTVALALERPNEQFLVTLPATLRSSDGEPLKDNAGILIESSDLVGSFTQQGIRRVLLPGEDVGPLGIATNLDWVRLDQRIYSADERVADKPVKRRLRSDNRAKEVTLAKKPSRAWRRDGGWIDGRIGGVFGTTDYSIINAPLHLAALRSRKEVLVWASQWSDHAARAGISVELLRRKNDKLLFIASALTQADGVAKLAISDGGGGDNRWEGAAWIVRAIDGDQTTYLPLEGDIAGERESSSIDYSDRGEDGAGMIWGVTDRPLYRPGETVRYRLWSAGRDRNRLRLGESGDQLDLVLDEGAGYWNSKPWQQWSTTLDAHGSVSGERILPKDIVDGSFCISSKKAGGGACFRVANHHASALWAETSVERKVVHVGEMLDVVVEAGYYSGGAAAGARAEPTTLLMPTPLEEAYPAFADYRFIDTAGGENNGGETLGDGSRPVATLDNEGRHRFHIAARNPRIDDNPDGERGPGIPFGSLKINSSVSVSAASATTSSTAEVHFSRYREFVGLKVEGRMTTDSDLVLSTIVIDAEGQVSKDLRPVRIDIMRAASGNGRSPTHADEQVALAHCTAEPGRATPCAFRAPASGFYLFRAQRDGAATVEIQRYFSAATSTAEVDADSDATMERVGNDVILRQPFARAKVLFAVQHGQVVTHWIVDVDQREYRFPFPTQADWAPGITLGALVLDTGNPDPRQRTGSLWRTAALDISVARETRSPLTIQVPTTPRRPGMPVDIRLSNAGKKPLDVTIAVIDEALRVQATDEVDLQKPQADAWLGALEHWSVPQWSALSQWVEPGKLIRHLALSTAAGSSALYDEPVTQVGEARWDGEADKLETVVVTGSRINAVDLFDAGTRPDRKLRSSTATTGLPRDARLRQNFADTAYWQPSLAIAPGATETIQVPLPDNLTRWRVVAWSNDGQAFHLDEADVTASMPVEARIEAPSRLFPGDQCEIALSARNRLGGSALTGLELLASGAGIDLQRRSTATVKPDHGTRVMARLEPAQEGRIDLQARVKAGNESDAVAASVPVHSSFGRDRVALAGWLGDETLLLRRPSVPAGATDLRLKLAVHRQLDGLASTWIRGLHEYPHRCWEQQLSRAVGAAAALRIGKPEQWPDAAALIDEVLRNAPAFRPDGLYTFFPASYGEPKSPPYLTVYSLQVFDVLKAWGHAVPQPLIDQAREAIDRWVGSTFRDRAEPTDDDRSVLMAYLAIADGDVAQKWIGKVQASWPSLAPWQRSTLLIALSKAQAQSADVAQRRDELSDAAPLRGGRRVLDVANHRLFALGSNLRDQCAVIDALQRTGAASTSINEWQRGLVDLYTGGSWSTDSQASARCLMGLLGASQPSQRSPVRVSVQVGAERRVIDLSADDDQQGFEMAWPETATDVQLEANAAHAMVGFVGELDYRIDQRRSTESSSGLRIDRDYAVLREGKWVPVGSSPVADGSWVRVRLIVHTAALRHHVAVVDQVPGGLRPEDLSLDRVAGVELADADTGTPWFETRQLVDTEARFYADALPPGSHEVIYYTRAAHRGDFLALPARAELMYGRASVARTAAMRLKIGSDGAPR